MLWLFDRIKIYPPFFVGQVMKASKGSANPQVVNKLLKERLV